MPDPPWQILVVDDDQKICEQLVDFLEGEEVDDDGSHPAVQFRTKFDDAVTALDQHRFDLVILDVLQENGDSDEEAGIRALREIKAHRFVPVVFYTAIPGAVGDQESLLVRVVEKTETIDALLPAVKATFASQFPRVNRVLVSHLEEVQRAYMWDFVEQNWNPETGDALVALADQLSRRLAASLAGEGVNDLAEKLGIELQKGAMDCVTALRYYVFPPVVATPLAGDLFRGRVDGAEGYWILLTPSCDFAQKKAEFVLLGRCLALEGEAEYIAWKEGLPEPSKTVAKDLTSLLRNNRTKQPERFLYLPSALTLPDLLIDFQQVEKIQLDMLSDLERVASLDSPFAEALIARFTRYFGRLGVPDLNVDSVMARLAEAPAPA